MKTLALPSLPNAGAGMTLVEILVTLVILSTGLLAVAHLQIAALRNNQSAYLATLAAQQAQDLAERMRANPAGLAATAYATSGVASVQTDCDSTDCTPEALASYDLARWSAAIQRLLPEGTGLVSDLGQGFYLVAVRWRDVGLEGQSGWTVGSTSATACGTPQPGLRCFVLRVQA
jgi:type IV pilus assembly protein PilV